MKGPKDENSPDDGKLYVVRLYDGFDQYWLDVSKPVVLAEANKEWNKRTGNGTSKTSFNDIDYYAVFPSGTRMIFDEPAPGR